MKEIDGQRTLLKSYEKGTHEVDRNLEILLGPRNGSMRLPSIAVPENLLASLRSEARWVGTRKLSRIVDVHPNTLAKLRAENGLPAIWFGGRWKFFLPSVASWLEGNSTICESDKASTDKQAATEEVGSAQLM